MFFDFFQMNFVNNMCNYLIQPASAMAGLVANDLTKSVLDLATAGTGAMTLKYLDLNWPLAGMFFFFFALASNMDHVEKSGLLAHCHVPKVLRQAESGHYHQIQSLQIVISKTDIGKYVLIDCRFHVN